eukprot:341613_1
MSLFGTSSHIPFTNSPSKPKQQQILKGIDTVLTDDILATHRKKSAQQQELNTTISHLTNIAGTIPKSLVKKIAECNNSSNQPHKSNKYQNEYHNKKSNDNNKEWHRRTGREEDLDCNPSLMEFLKQPTLKSRCSHKEKQILAEAHHNITQHMLKSINKSTKNESQYKLLTCALQITGPEKMDEKDLNDSKFFENIEKGRFITRFDLNYDEWMEDIENNKQEFINEIACALNVERYEITINDIRKGSVIIDFLVKNIWIPFYISKLQIDAIRTQDEYFMRSQDQIEVEYERKWYAATICTVIDDGNQNGKHFKIRYNPEQGKNMFWRNTEWFFSKKQASRLKFKNQLYSIVTDQGEQKNMPWNPPELAKKNDVRYIEENDHIFVDFKGHWRRCVVVNKVQKLNGISIKVFCLMNGDKKELCLWKNDDKDLISFIDMRDHPMGTP